MEPIDFEYGERQYEAEDLAGHRWTFSETLADVAPRNGEASPSADRPLHRIRTLMSACLHPKTRGQGHLCLSAP